MLSSKSEKGKGHQMRRSKVSLGEKRPFLKPQKEELGCWQGAFGVVFEGGGLARFVLGLVSVCGLFNFSVLWAQEGSIKEGWQEALRQEGKTLWRQQRVLMGTVLRVELVAESHQREAAAREAVEAAFEVAEQWAKRASFFDAQSELSQLNKAGLEEQRVSVPLSELLGEALFLAEATDSFFDPTLGRPMRLWRKSRKEGRLPSPQERKGAWAASGRAQVEWEAEKRVVRKKHPALLWDLGGIAKGFILDKMAECLRQRGFSRFLLSTTSDFLAGEPPLDKAGTGWLVSYPSGKKGEKKSLFLSRSALSTSGTQYQLIFIEGRAYAHLLDRKTGVGTEAQGSCTVWALRAYEADGWATACFLEPSLRPDFGQCLWASFGEEKGEKREGKRGLSGFFFSVGSFFSSRGEEDAGRGRQGPVYVLGREEGE